MLHDIGGNVASMTDPEDVWWRLADDIPVRVIAIDGEREQVTWSTFCDDASHVSADWDFIATHRPIRVLR